MAFSHDEERVRAERARAIGLFRYSLICEPADTGMTADYRATRPKVERKLGHLMRRKHGGRRARVRGKDKVDADFNLLAAAINLTRLTVLGLRSTGTGWAAGTASD